ncbi:MAG: hypothetical protein ACHQSE_13435 [Gemmatimonadales bacterium]|jgi:hypothetical protein
MTKVINRHARSATLLLGVLALTLLLAPAPVAALPAHGIAGFGFWAALGCIGCIGGFVVGGGLTVAGLAVFLAANPQLGLLCVATCAAAM